MIECPDCGLAHDMSACAAVAAMCDCCASIEREEAGQ